MKLKFVSGLIPIESLRFVKVLEGSKITATVLPTLVTIIFFPSLDFST